MEKIFFVVNNNLDEVNNELSKGGRLKLICPIAESVSIAGKGDAYTTDEVVGDVFAYVVIEYKE